jgi:hypothetical protein
MLQPPFLKIIPNYEILPKILKGNAPEYRRDTSISRIIVETNGIWK